jgi:phosphate transport system substrate-binding protein
MIGVVGLNWLYQPSPDMKDLIKKRKVFGEGNEEYIVLHKIIY